MHKRLQQQRGGGSKGGKPAAQTGMSPPWRALMQAVELMCRSAGSISDEDIADACQELCVELSKLSKSKFQHEKRLQMIEMCTGAMEEYMTVVCTADEKQQKSIELNQLIESMYTSSLGVLGETISGAGGENKSTSEKQKEYEYEVIGLLQMIEVMLGSSLSTSKTAQSLFLPHYIPVVKICVDLAVSEARSYEVRNISVKLVETVIDIDGDTDILINKQTDASKELLQYIIDNCFVLCSSQEDELIDPNEFQAVDLGTELLDAVLQTFTDSTTVVTQCSTKCKSVVNTSNATSQRHDIKGAVSILGVLPDYISHMDNAAEQARDIQSILTPLLSSKDALIKGTAYVTEAEVIEYLYSQSVDVKSYTPTLLSSIASELKDTKQDIAVRIKSTLALSKLFAVIDLDDSALRDSINSLIDTILQQGNKTLTSKTMRIEDAELLESYLLTLRAAFVNTCKSKSTHVKRHIDKVTTLINAVLQQTDVVFHGCRANGTLVYAELCELMGSEYTAQLIKPNSDVVKQMADNYGIAHYGVRAATHAFFAKAALQVKQEIMPHLELITTSVDRVLAADYSISEGGHKHHHSEHDDEEEDESSDEDYDGEGDEGDEGEEADPEEVTAERTCALLLYRSLVTSLQAEFASHNNKLFATLYANARDYDEEMRADVCQVLAVIPKLLALPPAYQPGVSFTLSAEQRQLLKQTLQLLFFYVHYASEAEFVVAALNGITAFLSHTGQAPLMGDDRALDVLTQLLKALLQGKNLCQQSYGTEIPKPDADDMVLKPEMFGIDMRDMFGDEGEDEGDVSDDDAPALVDNSAPQVDQPPSQSLPTSADDSQTTNSDFPDDVADTVAHLSISAHTHTSSCGADCASADAAQPQPLETAIIDTLIQLAKVRGSAFDSTFTKLYLALKSTFDNDKYHCYSIGAVGEIALAVGSAITPHSKELLPLLFDRLGSKSNDALVDRFFSYTLGMLALKSNPQTLSDSDVKQAESLLLHVYKTYSGAGNVNDNTAAAADNAVSALARLIMSHMDQLNLQQTVPTVLSGLPLKADFSELNSCCAAVVKLINTLPTTDAQIYNDNKSELKRALTDISSHSAASDKVKQFAQQALQQIK